ncbi:uncharacterized protein LOC123790471 isoform X1 [Ursus americanus]|uniref:uncharacterized protein LOC123790471 isoform X1 n=1 Tax=Ursus americanus TaxID=9643 RepID=UPI001E67D2D3|nr:uncharacterized protein LOC123790471 isoform X1 [Ursus americanus]
MPGTPGGRAGSGRGRVGLCVETAAGAAGVLWEAPGFGEEGGTLFQAGRGQHGQSDPEATEVGLWPLEAGIDADAGRRRQVGHHLPEVRSQARPGPPTWRSGSASSLAKRGNRGQDEAFTPRMLETVLLSAASGRLCPAWGVLPAPGSGRGGPTGGAGVKETDRVQAVTEHSVRALRGALPRAMTEHFLEEAEISRLSYCCNQALRAGRHTTEISCLMVLEARRPKARGGSVTCLSPSCWCVPPSLVPLCAVD